MDVGEVGASLFKGCLRLWSTSSKLMSSRSVVANVKPPGNLQLVGPVERVGDI